MLCFLWLDKHLTNDFFLMQTSCSFFFSYILSSICFFLSDNSREIRAKQKDKGIWRKLNNINPENVKRRNEEERKAKVTEQSTGNYLLMTQTPGKMHDLNELLRS